MKTIATLAALVMMATPSFAATKKTTAKTTKTETTSVTPKQTENTTSTHTTSNSSMPVHFSASFNLGTAGSSFHFGPTVNGLVSVANTEIGEIEVGGQTGFLFHPGTVTTWIIPIMVSGQLNFKPTGNIKPFAALSMGLGIFHYGISSTFNGITASASDTSTDFAMLIKGGVMFGENNKYYVELPLGTLGNAFAILPGVGMKF